MMKQLDEMTIAEMDKLYNWTWGRYRMTVNDALLGLAVGDVVVCVAAGYDREKLIALFRESDRRVLGLALYRSQVVTLGNYRGERR